MRIFVDLMLHEVQMMRVLDALQKKDGCSPKKRVLIGEFRAKHPQSGADAERAFRKLTLVDIIEHSRNGHCWLTDKGAQALL